MFLGQLSKQIRLLDNFCKVSPNPQAVVHNLFNKSNHRKTRKKE